MSGEGETAATTAADEDETAAADPATDAADQAAEAADQAAEAADDAEPRGGRDHYRRAILVIHGMGEQRPLDTLDRLAGAVLADQPPADRTFFSRPTRIGNSYEARRLIVPPIYDRPDGNRQQTDLYEYHWSYLMQGNQLSDLLGTLRRVMLQPPWRVPGGIRLLWVLLWGLVAFLVWRAAEILPLEGADGGDPTTVEYLQAFLGTGAAAAALLYLVGKFLMTRVTKSFVDVVRYLDTSPRSYALRAEIRRGAVELLRDLNDQYDRVSIVAHSLGSYIAYDAIRQLWGELDTDYGDPTSRARKDGVPSGLDKVEDASVALLARGAKKVPEAAVDAYHEAQYKLQKGLRAAGHRWNVTDLISLGSPMYMADQLYTKNRTRFAERVERHELPTCPPVDDHESWRERSGQEPQRTRRWSYVHPRLDGRRVLYDAAPFAVVRWTNMWFPAWLWFFGDYFGGPLAPLFGPGIRDVRITRGSLWRLVPGWAHAKYFEVIRDDDSQLREAFHRALRRR